MKRKIDDHIKKYVNYIEENLETICNQINLEFDLKKEEIKKFIFDDIKTTFKKGNVIHYEWYYDECPWDNSGDLREEGFIDTNQTLENFYNEEYTGSWSPTFESHRGKNFDTYGDQFSYDTLDYGCTILRNKTKNILEKIFNENINEELFLEIMDYSFDEIYSNCIAYDFFSTEGVLKFLDIEDILIEDILNNNS